MSWESRAALISGTGLVCLIIGMQLFFFGGIDEYLFYGIIGFMILPFITGISFVKGLFDLKIWLTRIILLIQIVFYWVFNGIHYIQSTKVEFVNLTVWLCRWHH